MLVVRCNAGESIEAAVRRYAETRGANVEEVLADYRENLAEGLSPNDAGLDALFGHDVDDCSEVHPYASVDGPMDPEHT